MIDNVTIQRLALIRYLYNSAVEESRKPEPIGSTSILMFHDSIELFLQLASEHLNAGKNGNIEFLQYWDILAPKLQGSGLEQKESMRRLNKARVAFKHNGTLPSKLDIEGFRASAANFFEDNTPLVFSIKFNAISLTTLVQNNKVKTLLEDAQSLLEQGKRGEALDKIAISFAQLLGDERETKFGWRHQKLFFLGNVFRPHLWSQDSQGINRNFVDYIKELADAVKEMQEAMSIFCLGLEYQRYVKFKLWTPPVVRFMGREDYDIPRSPNAPQQSPLPSADVCNFCYDFVVESAIRLQNFDFAMQD